MFERSISLLGLFAFMGMCYGMSENRKAIRWKTVIGGCLLQIAFAIVILKTAVGRAFFVGAQATFDRLMEFSIEGAKFVFGPLADMKLSGQVFGPANAFMFAVQVTGTIIFISSLMAVMYHLGIMQRVVYAFAVVMQKFMGTSGSESLASAVNVFVGQTEAPLVIRPYLDNMTRSEVMALMTGGMANLAGGVLAAYVSFGVDAGHLIAGSVMSAPASLVIAKILVPETKKSETIGSVNLHDERPDANLLDSACRGASEGMTMSINVMAMLIAFVALVAMVNHLLGWSAHFFTDAPVTMERILGYFCAPFAWLMGVPNKDVLQVGSLLGVKTVLNEFVAYLQLVKVKDAMDPRSVVIATYALCGFANFSSIAIQIGGIGSLIPKRRKDLAALGFRALIGGTFSTFMTATIAGVFI